MEPELVKRKTTSYIKQLYIWPLTITILFFHVIVCCQAQFINVWYRVGFAVFTIIVTKVFYERLQDQIIGASHAKKWFGSIVLFSICFSLPFVIAISFCLHGHLFDYELIKRSCWIFLVLCAISTVDFLCGFDAKATSNLASSSFGDDYSIITPIRGLMTIFGCYFFIQTIWKITKKLVIKIALVCCVVYVVLSTMYYLAFVAKLSRFWTGTQSYIQEHSKLNRPSKDLEAKAE